MAPSIIEKYQQILAADPRSRIFVELARALVERGDHARAVQVCQHGLEHHPGSILGRVTWGRALLLTGDARAAHDQFEIAIGIDPANPYAYNLVGEALARAGLFKEALPVLTRAHELQPADAKVKAALEEARRRASGGTIPAMAAMPAVLADEPLSDPAAAPAPAAKPAPAAAAPRPKAKPAAPAVRPTQLAIPAAAAPPTEAAPAEAAPAAPAEPPAAPPTDPELEPERTEQLSMAPPLHDGDLTEELTLKLSIGPLDAEEEEEQLSLDALEEEAVEPPAAPSAAPARPAGQAGPPPVLTRSGGPDAPVKKGPPGPRTLLTMIPPGAPPPPATTPATAAAAPSAAEAARIAEAYERELREKAAQAAAAVPPPPPRRRALVAGVALALVGGAAVAAYLYVDGQTRAKAAQRAVVEARAGLARDTRGSLQAAAEVLASARRSPPSSPEVRGQLASLAAQVAALRAVDHGDAGARTLALQLADDPQAGDGGLMARLLLSEKPAERAAAESTVLASRPGDAPLLQRLAGQLLVKQGQVESGRGRLRIAAQATPPLLGALADLGDSYLAGGDPEAALPLFEAAIAAHPTHPRAVLGAAEARLALERPLDGSLAELQAVDADAGSAPPLQARLRWEVAFARVLAARGDLAAASRRLKFAAGSLGESAGLEAARAGLLLEGRDFEQAEEAAARAVRLDPKSADHRVTLARARLGLHRHQGALQALLGFDGRPVWLARGLALEGLGQHAQARAALEKTVRNGKMPTEAATTYALADLGLGRADAALLLLDKLAAGKAPGAAVHAAHGRALLAVKQADAAEAACRRAIERDSKLPDGPLCLGRVLLAAGKQEAAAAALEQAVGLDKLDPEAARLLAAARAPKPPPAPPKRTPPPPKPPARRK